MKTRILLADDHRLIVPVHSPHGRICPAGPNVKDSGEVVLRRDQAGGARAAAASRAAASRSAFHRSGRSSRILLAGSVETRTSMSPM